MKKLIRFLGLNATAFLMCTVAFAGTKLNIQNNFGYTVVDVGQAMDIDAFSSVSGQGLSDWDQFNYKLLGQLFFEKSAKVSHGVELGLHRLYRWEEAYKPYVGSSQRWRGGVIWTMEAGYVAKYAFGEHYYVLSGLSIHNFLNGSGMTLGVPFALGHEIKFSDKFSMPLEFRVDVIFGSGTPIAIGGGLGLQFDLPKRD